MPTFFDDRRPHNGWTYDEYRDQWTDRAEASMKDKDRSERKMLHYLRYNLDRQAGVHNAYEPSPNLRQVIDAIDAPQVWMVLTEPWCGDSSFVLPVIAEAAALSDQITLRILPRDEHLDIMDQYLTNGSRSIPKLVVFSEDGTEQFEWGPRPESAAALYARLKKEYDDKSKSVKKLIEHYEEGGWKDVEAELVDALKNTVSAPA